MTVETFQRLVINIANRAHVRCWYHWNAPVENPWFMALSVLDYQGNPIEQDDLESEFGMTRHPAWRKNGVWFVQRTQADGSPFRNVL